MKCWFVLHRPVFIMVIVFYILLVFLFCGCSSPKRDAIGSFNAVQVLVDPAERKIVEEPLRLVLEIPIQTPRPEKLFRVHIIDSADFEYVSRCHIVMAVASLRAGGHVGEFIRRSLNEDAIDAVKKGEAQIFVKRDPWAKKQILIILTARSPEEIYTYVMTHGGEIFKLIDDFANEQISHWLFGEFQGVGERKDLEEKIAMEYGFGIRIPRNFEWEKGNADERFLWLRALEPERWVFVYWEPLDSAGKKMTVGRLFHLRDSLCSIYYDGDSLVPDRITWETSELAGKLVPKYRAFWKNSRRAIGGPVVGYILDDTLNRRRYIIDMAVFAPGIRKEPYLRHCDIIAKSFEPSAQKFMEALKLR